MKNIYAIVFISLFVHSVALAQLTVQDSVPAQQLANLLAGPEISVFNAVLFDTTQNQSGTFNYIGNDLEGLIMGLFCLQEM